MTTLVWIHEDVMGAWHPLHHLKDAKKAFIFDETYLKKQNYSLKRIQFLYEAAIDAELSIYKGETRKVLKSLAEEASVPKIVTAPSPNPWINNLIDSLESDGISVEMCDTDPFVGKLPNKDFKRFFQFWKYAKKSVMKST